MPRNIDFDNPGLDYQGVETQRLVPASLDSVVLRSIGRQELKGMISGNWALWGLEEHYSDDGYRGDIKPDDNSESDMILAGNPDRILPPDGSAGKNPTMEDLDRMMGSTLLEEMLSNKNYALNS